MTLLPRTPIDQRPGAQRRRGRGVGGRASGPRAPRRASVLATTDIRQAEIRRDRWRRRAERAPWPWLNRILAGYAEQAELIRIEALRRLHVEARRN